MKDARLHIDKPFPKFTAYGTLHQNKEGVMKDLSPSSEPEKRTDHSTQRPELGNRRPADFGMMMRRPDDLERIPKSHQERLED